MLMGSLEESCHLWEVWTLAWDVTLFMLSPFQIPCRASQMSLDRDLFLAPASVKRISKVCVILYNMCHLEG